MNPSHYTWSQQWTGSSMQIHPTERHVNWFLFQTRIRTMRKSVLDLPVHDEQVTMAEPTRLKCTNRTRLSLDSTLKMVSLSKALRHTHIPLVQKSTTLSKPASVWPVLPDQVPWTPDQDTRSQNEVTEQPFSTSVAWDNLLLEDFN